MIIGNKRSLVVYNVEYEMTDSTGERVTWKANILSHENSDDAIRFISAYTKKRINILSISDVAHLDGVTDKALEYMARVPR